LNKVSGNKPEKEYDVIIVGAGILGVTLSYWVSAIPGTKVCLIEASDEVAMHSSSRNTGVIHRPFYMNPEKKRLFAWASQKSYTMWKSFALRYNLPWNPAGTLEIAKREKDLDRLDNFSDWAVRNGMKTDEFTIFDQAGMKHTYPYLSGKGAILSKTDTSVDFGIFTHAVFNSIKNRDFTFMPGTSVDPENIDSNRSTVLVTRDGNWTRLGFRHLINAAGSDSLEIAHKMGLARDKGMLHFRGDYWKVLENAFPEIRHNIYTIPEHPEFPFLDPHFIIRHDNSRQIGPNAAPVFSAYAYEGISERLLDPLRSLFEKPIMPKLKLLTNREFLSLAGSEWESSLSKSKMGLRVKEFIPGFSNNVLVDRGIAGIRHSVIDKEGFLEDSVILEGPSSTHIINYNSPGATGSPAYSAHIVHDLLDSGFFGERKTLKTEATSIWRFEDVFS
jgi:L-2-hydroxyglutarate oxidase